MLNILHFGGLSIIFLSFQAALSLRESYMLKAPNSKLCGKDKAAVVAKELGDFLGHYKRETELFTVFREESGMVPRHIFEEFIAFASDSGSTSCMISYNQDTSMLFDDSSLGLCM